MEDKPINRMSILFMQRFINCRNFQLLQELKPCLRWNLTIF